MGFLGGVMDKFYRPLAKLVLMAAMVAGVSLVAPTAEASTILFQSDDLTDNIYNKVYVDGIQVIDNQLVGEALIGTFPLHNYTNGLLSPDVNVALNIFDPDGKTLSDTLSLVAAGGGTGVAITFYSDPWPDMVVLQNAQSVIETGDWQTALNAQLSNGDTFIFQFRSDVETPLPGAIWLFGSALAGAACVRKRRKKHKAAPALAAA